MLKYFIIPTLLTILALKVQAADNAYNINTTRDISITLGVATLYVFGFYEYKQMKVTEKLDKEDLFPWDKPVAGTYRPNFALASNIISGLAIIPLSMPLVSLCNGDINKTGALTYYLMALQISGIESGLNLLFRSKEIWARPYMYGTSGGKARSEAQSYGSFYSGHASAAFATAVFTGMWFSRTYPNSSYKPLVWITSLSAATAVATFRVLAGKHFPTDVIIGALAGSVISFTILKIHETKDNSLSLAGCPMGLFLHYNF